MSMDLCFKLCIIHTNRRYINPSISLCSRDILSQSPDVMFYSNFVVTFGQLFVLGIIAYMGCHQTVNRVRYLECSSHQAIVYMLASM